MEKVKVLWVSLGVMIAINLSLIGFLCVKHCRHSGGYSGHKQEQGCEHNHDGFSKKAGKEGHKKDFNPIERMKKELDLTEDQLVKINLLNDDKEESMNQIKVTEQKLRGELVDLLKSNSKDEAKRDSLLNVIGQNKAEQSLHFFNYFSSIREICTQDQKNKFDEMMVRMNQRMSGKH